MIFNNTKFQYLYFYWPHNDLSIIGIAVNWIISFWRERVEREEKEHGLLFLVVARGVHLVIPDGCR